MNPHPSLAMRRRTTQQPLHTIGMADLDGRLERIIESARRLKSYPLGGKARALSGRSVILILEKHSTRTRVSFEVGVHRLGGQLVVLDGGGSQMARGESIEDTAAVLGRYAHAIVYRAKRHDDIVAMAKHSGVPVINALSDLEHPCQVLADWMTLMERWGTLRGRTFAYVGDGNNMCHSYLLGAAIAGMHIRVATPIGYEPSRDVVEQAEVWARMNGSTVTVTTDPVEAVTGADAVATDTWISMGDEAEAEARLETFAPYRVDAALFSNAMPDALFVHCLPGHWGHEATKEVAHGPRSVIYDQAENRMWVQMALLLDALC